MKLKSTRLFIKNLRSDVNEEELKHKFSNYGTVTAVEVKERKSLVGNQTQYFAYITLDIENNSLQNCIQECSNTKWKGYFLDLQIAKESFIDRLKREREEVKTQPTLSNSKINGLTKSYEVNSSTNTHKRKFDDYSHEEGKSENIQIDHPICLHKYDESLENTPKADDVKIISGLKSEDNILGLCNETQSKKKKLDHNEEDNIKRLQSLKQMKEGYRQQKQLIKNALSNIDSNKGNKILFDDYGIQKGDHSSSSTKAKQKLALFDEEEEDDNKEDYNLKIRDELDGLKGQKLMQLQSQFKNDERFKMDSRFLEDDLEEDYDENMDYNEEKEKQMNILESVLGEKVKRYSSTKEAHSSKRPTNMLRFDPSQPEHSQYEVKLDQKNNLKRTKKEKKAIKSTELSSQPEVSKETFYSVQDDFKKTLYGTQEFSLSKLFNKVIEEEETEKHPDEMPICIKTTQEYDLNPFKYDSSDDEDKEENVVSEPVIERAEKVQVKPRLWTETFFFKEDDYRLQEGLDFIKRLQLGEQENFQTVRRNLKEIIKAKVKNNLRKNRPFKRKLGGKNKNRIKIKKALKS